MSTAVWRVHAQIQNRCPHARRGQAVVVVQLEPLALHGIAKHEMLTWLLHSVSAQMCSACYLPVSEHTDRAAQRLRNSSKCGHTPLNAGHDFSLGADECRLCAAPVRGPVFQQRVGWSFSDPRCLRQFTARAGAYSTKPRTVDLCSPTPRAWEANRQSTPLLNDNHTQQHTHVYMMLCIQSRILRCAGVT